MSQGNITLNTRWTSLQLVVEKDEERESIPLLQAQATEILSWLVFAGRPLSPRVLDLKDGRVLVAFFDQGGLTLEYSDQPETEPKSRFEKRFGKEVRNDGEEWEFSIRLSLDEAADLHAKLYDHLLCSLERGLQGEIDSLQDDVDSLR